MHNCKRTKEALLDLVFEEINAEQRARLKSDLNQCPRCRAEYASLGEVLGTVDHVFGSNAPAEDFWPGYEARLTQRLNESARSERVSPREQTWFGQLKNVFFFPVRIPVSVAAVFLLFLTVSTLVAVRARRPVTQPPVVERVVETRNVEVPVIKDRVVTRVVYVDKKTRGRNNNADSKLPKTLDPSRTPANLAGFRPIDQVKLTVIKGTDSNEK